MIRQVNMTIDIDEDRLAELKEYLAHMSHDLATPLRSWVLPVWAGQDTSMDPLILWAFDGQ